MRLTIIPLPLDEANTLVARWHRHSNPVVGHKFSLGAALGDDVVGAAIIGRQDFECQAVIEPTCDGALRDGWRAQRVQLPLRRIMAGRSSPPATDAS